MEIEGARVENLAKEIKILRLASTPRRSDRKRSLVQLYQPELKSAEPAPKKPKNLSLDSDKKIEKFYTNQSRVFARQHLETISEAPVNAEDGVISFNGVPKIKRWITFPRDSGPVTKQKQMFRSKRVKRLGIPLEKKKRMSNEEFEKRLKNINNFLESPDGKMDISGWCAQS